MTLLMKRRRPVVSLFDELNRLTEDMTRSFGDSWLTGTDLDRPLLEGVPSFTPKVDLSETETEVSVAAELPGLGKDDVKVELDEGSLTIQGEKKEEKENKDRRWHRTETSYGSFCRVLRLPVKVNAAKAAAKFEDGVLTITMPKAEEEKDKRHTLKIA